MNTAATAKAQMDAEAAGLPELSADELATLEQEALGKGKNALAEDGLPDTFSEEDLAFLSDEERASMQEDQEFLRVVPTAPETPPEPAPKAAEPAPQPAPPPEIKIDMAAIAAEVDAAIKDKRAEIMDAYDEGDLTRAEMEAKLSDLITEAATLRSTKAEEARTAALAEQQHERMVADWSAALAPYTTKYPELFEEGTEILSAWDAELKAINANPHLFRTMSHAERIDLALQRFAPVAAKMGKPIKLEAMTAPQPDKVTPRPGAERPAGPPTLVSIPASDPNAANDGRFATLDRLIDTDPDAAERAQARLSPEELEAYLAGRD